MYWRLICLKQIIQIIQIKTFKSSNKWTPVYKEEYENEEVFILNKGSYLNWKTI